MQFHCFRSLHCFQRQGEFPSRADPPEESWSFKIFPVFTETHHFEICLHQLSLCKELQCCLRPVVASKRSWQDFKNKVGKISKQSWQDFKRNWQDFKIRELPPNLMESPSELVELTTKWEEELKKANCWAKTEKQFVANEIQKKKKAKQHLAKLASRESWLT